MSWLRTYFSMSLGVCSVALYSFYVYSFGYGPKFTVSWRAEPGLLNQVDMMWHPPAQSWLSDLTTVVNGTGTYGLHFSGSDLPDGAKYGEYNYCNMPHVRTKEYKKPNSSYELLYVEVIHRHHKRTPYKSNLLPKEPYPWNCDDEQLFIRAQPTDETYTAAQGYWSITVPSTNPFSIEYPTNSTCLFPQITHGGLLDSYLHGSDLSGVYHGLLNFLPSSPSSAISFHVTNNLITSQVANMLGASMYPLTSFPLHLQPPGLDSLEPSHSCPRAASLYRAINNSTNTPWAAHLRASRDLYSALDTITGMPPDDAGFHASWDHYFDNLSTRLCHGLSLPCFSPSDSPNSEICITRAQAEAVIRLGTWEYFHIARAAGPTTLVAAAASYGAWIAGFLANLKDAGESGVKYRHQVAHDGSLMRVLAVLQVEEMMWPGMGAEIVFEVWRIKGAGKVVRVLWGGQVLKSSSPVLGKMDMIPMETVVGYLEELVGVGGSKVLEACRE